LCLSTSSANLWQLIDLQADPMETRSFYDDPDYREPRARLHAELNRLRDLYRVTEPPPAR